MAFMYWVWFISEHFVLAALVNLKIYLILRSCGLCNVSSTFKCYDVNEP